jgi:type II secretory pathway pseudopilin PulG
MKKNGFVFIETIVVICVLSVTLLLLFSSYSYMLRKSRERGLFDNTDSIYKTYYVKQMIDRYKSSYGANDSRTSIKFYIDRNSECKQMGSYASYVCDLSSDSYSGQLLSAKLSYEVEKIYLLNPSDILKSSSSESWLSLFDATTIDYINELGVGSTNDLIIVKYKKVYNDGTYEVFHSSIEV